MLKLVGTDAANQAVEFSLFDDNNRPTALFLGLVAAELALDCLVAFAAYKLIKTAGSLVSNG
ncbi:MAG: hypothetical protein IJ113_05130 [Eggerthellaceae bacterium]|nr:hypothetical protein [Eggerthellaceae bacterium]